MLKGNESDAAVCPDRPLFVTPATPGFYVLSPVTDPSEPGFLEADRDPVIAWALCASGCVYPVTADTGINQHGDPAILCPDGQVRDSHGGWAELADWLNSQNAEGLV